MNIPELIVRLRKRADLAGEINETVMQSELLATADTMGKLLDALKPFADGADQIPADWPDHRALLIDKDHPDNPKNHCLLLARVQDFRKAKALIPIAG